MKYGVTTVRDSYGVLPPLVAVRDEIAAARLIGPRILAAGNIVGWGGPYSVSFSLIREQALTLFQEQVNDEIAQGVGENLVDLNPEELRDAIRAYLDKGPDFVKYGGTAHFSRPAFIGFSPEAQKVIVDEAHRRGKRGGNARDHGRRFAPVDRRRHRSDSASRAPRHARAAGHARAGDRRAQDRVLDAGEHDHGRRLEETPEGSRRGGGQAGGSGEKDETPQRARRRARRCASARRKTASSWRCAGGTRRR